MPLYELILLARCGEAKGTANLFRQIALNIFEKGGNVREMQLLGDRLLPKQSKGRDNEKHIVGRYMQVLYDGNLEAKESSEKIAKDSYETIRYRTYRIKDFFSDAQLYKKAVRQQSPILEEGNKNRRFIRELIDILDTKKK